MYNFLFNIVHLLRNPVVFFLVLFFLIITQFFGYLFNIILLFASLFYSIYIYLFIVITSGLLAETFNFLLGRHYSKWFKNRYRSLIENIHEYTTFYSILLAKFLGIPFLSHLLGLGRLLKFWKFLLVNFVFFYLNAIIVFFLGKTIPFKYYWIIILFLFIISLFQFLFHKRKLN